MDKRDLHSSSIGIFTDDSSEGVHLELSLLSFRDIYASWNSFNVQVDRQRTIRIHRSRSLRSHIGFLCLDLCFFKAGNLSHIRDCKLPIDGFDDKTVLKFYSYCFAESDDLALRLESIRTTLRPVLRPSLESFGLGVAVAGVTFGDILTSDVFSDKVTFPFRALKSDMIVFFAMCLSFGYHDHKGHGNNGNQDTCDDVRGESLAEYQGPDKNRCDRFEDSQY